VHTISAKYGAVRTEMEATFPGPRASGYVTIKRESRGGIFSREGTPKKVLLFGSGAKGGPARGPGITSKRRSKNGPF